MATNALKIAQEFSIDKIINQLISYYNQLIK
jgi:hypothetical protein